MKILFAISNENVLNKIVDSYRNRYGEAEIGRASCRERV